MLRAYALNPSSDDRLFAEFPPPECEFDAGCPGAGSVASSLLLYLAETGAVRAVEPDVEFPRADWLELPQRPAVGDLLLPQAQVVEMGRELAGYRLDLEAFRRYWLAELYGGTAFVADSHPADAAAADVAPEVLTFLRRVLDRGSAAEWLMVEIAAEPSAAADPAS